MISFSVAGIPKPQGSKHAFHHAKTGRVMMVESCAALKDWRASVAYHAASQYTGTPVKAPLSLTVTFFLPRPHNHYGTGRNASTVKKQAPVCPTKKSGGDLDKLVRGICDALTGIIWEDDSQVVSIVARKCYAGARGPGADITVWVLP